MKQETIVKIVRATITEFLIQNKNHMVAEPLHNEKYFAFPDLSGRTEKTVNISSRTIEETWNLTQIDKIKEQSLRGYLRNCNVGDVWRSKTEMLECLSIN